MIRICSCVAMCMWCAARTQAMAHGFALSPGGPAFGRSELTTQSGVGESAAAATQFPCGARVRGGLSACASLPTLSSPPAPFAAPLTGLMYELRRSVNGGAIGGSDAGVCRGLMSVPACEPLGRTLTDEYRDRSDHETLRLLSEARLALGALEIETTSALSALANDLLADADVDGLVEFGDLFGSSKDKADDLLVVVPLPFPIGLASVGLMAALALRRRVRGGRARRRVQRPPVALRAA